MIRQELFSITLFDDATDDELDWLLANSYEVGLAGGDYFYRENERTGRFYIVLEGELQVTRMIDGQEMIMGTTPKGIIGGELALLNGEWALLRYLRGELESVQSFEFDGDRISQVRIQRNPAKLAGLKRQSHLLRRAQPL